MRALLLLACLPVLGSSCSDQTPTPPGYPDARPADARPQGDAPPASGGPQPAAAGVGGGVPNLGSLAGTGPSSTLKLTLKGATTAKVDFMVETSPGAFQIVAQDIVTGPEATITAPATYAKPLHVFGWTDEAGNGPDPSDLTALVPDTLTFTGAPMELTLDFKTGTAAPNVGEAAGGGGPPGDGQAPPSGQPPPHGAEGTPPPGVDGGPPPGSEGSPPASAAPPAPTAPPPAGSAPPPAGSAPPPAGSAPPPAAGVTPAQK